jgi:hypothetical protein
MQLFQLQDDDSWVPVPPIVAPEPEPKIIYEIRQEGAGYDWVVRCAGKPIARSRFAWRASNFARDRARNEAVRDGITVLVREFTTNGSICERTWTPESARENRAAFREIRQQEMTMRLPDIPIPYAASLSANRFRFGEAKDRCLLCGRPVNMKRTRVVLLNDELGGITDPDQDPEYTGGCFDIGSDCWKRHPELHPYEVKGLPKGL